MRISQFEQVFGSLQSAGVRFLVVGGVAAIHMVLFVIPTISIWCWHLMRITCFVA